MSSPRQRMNAKYKKVDDDVAGDTPSLASRPFGQRVGPVILVLIVLLALGWGIQNIGNFMVDDVSKAPGTGFDRDASSIATEAAEKVLAGLNKETKNDRGNAPAGAIEGDLEFGHKKITAYAPSYDKQFRPKPGATVKMHYAGRLKDTGKEFDSSYARGPFVASLNNLIEGWKIGVPTMAIGENATFTIKSAYGYGAQGIGPIPPNADLIFDVSLLDIIG